MADRILVAYDGTEQAERALEYAVGEWPDAEFVLLYVINPTEAGYSASAGVPAGAEEWYESAKARAEGVLADAAEGLAVDPELVTDVGKPAAVVTEYATESGVDHVVVGSHGRQGISRILLGSVAEEIVRNSPVPVTVVR